MTYSVRVFISHSWSYSGHYDKLSEWIFDKSWNVDGIPLKFENYSVPRDNPIHFAANDRELKWAIDQRIILSDVVICPTGMYSDYSNWIGKELASSRDYRRPLLAVNPWAQERKSTVVRDFASEVVGWTAQSVVGGIWRLSRGLVSKP